MSEPSVRSRPVNFSCASACVLMMLGSASAGCSGDEPAEVDPIVDGGTTTPDAGGEPDGGEPDGSTPDAGPPSFDPMTSATRIADAFCAYEKRCRPVVLGFFALDETTCSPYVAAHVAPVLETAAAALADGRLTYDHEALEACIAELETYSCAPRPDASLCQDFLVGMRQANEPCRLDLECAGGYCDTAPPGASCGYPAVLTDLRGFMCVNPGDVCASCVTYAGRNESCEDRRCGPRLRCANVGGQGAPDNRCLPSDLPLDATCFTTTSGFCAFGLNCVGMPGLSTCVADAAEGETCASTNDLPLPAPRCQDGLICDNGRCTPVTIQPEGERCDNVVRLCSLESYCSGGRCTALPGPQQPCVQNSCGDGAFCENGTCIPGRTDGEMCTRGLECETGLVCTGPAGAGRCGAVRWEVCE